MYTLLLILSIQPTPHIEGTYATQQQCESAGETYRWNNEWGDGEYVRGALCVKNAEKVRL